MAKTRRLVSAEFKREAVQMASKPGNSVAQVAKDLELGESNLRSWMRQFGSGKWEAAPGKELKAGSTQELERVKRELNRVKMERDVLKKALGYFAKDPA
jgi:transposase